MASSTERAVIASGCFGGVRSLLQRYRRTTRPTLGISGDAITSSAGHSLLLATLAVPILASAAVAQPNTVHKATLQDQPFPPPVYQSVTVRTLVDAGGAVLPHTHPGVEMGYVLDGSAVLRVAGHPPRPLSAGDSFAIRARTVHSVQNAGSGPLTMLSTYIVDKDQPISSPAP